MGMPKVASIQKSITMLEIVTEGHGKIKYTNINKLAFLRLSWTFNWILLLVGYMPAEEINKKKYFLKVPVEVGGDDTHLMTY